MSLVSRKFSGNQKGHLLGLVSVQENLAFLEHNLSFLSFWLVGFVLHFCGLVQPVSCLTLLHPSFPG